MMSVYTLVVASLLGQTCQMTPNGMVCSSPGAMMSPQMYSNPYGMPQTMPSMGRAPFTLNQGPAMAPDGSYIVPGSVRFVSSPPARVMAAPAKAASARGAVAERRPYATPDYEAQAIPADELQQLLSRVRVLERDVRSQRSVESLKPQPKAEPPPARPASTGESAPGSPATQPENAARPVVGQLPANSTKSVVPLPSGDTAHLPSSPDGKVSGVKPGDAPGPVVTKGGRRLPDYATSGMLWKPAQREGYQASPHQEGHAFIESVQNPEAPVPEMIDDSGKFRVTVMSTNPDDRKHVVEDFKKGNGFLSPFKDTYLVRSTSPERWDVKTVGLASEELASGKPSVVMQEPSGRVFYATNKYTPEKAADALRKANPNFDPNKVPGMGSNGEGPLGISQSNWIWIGIGGIATVVILAMPRQQEVVV